MVEGGKYELVTECIFSGNEVTPAAKPGEIVIRKSSTRDYEIYVPKCGFRRMSGTSQYRDAKYVGRIFWDGSVSMADLLEMKPCETIEMIA